MALSHEHVGSKILAKIKIHILTRAELLFNLSMRYPVASILFFDYEKANGKTLLVTCIKKSLEIEVPIKNLLNGTSDLWENKCNHTNMIYITPWRLTLPSIFGNSISINSHNWHL